MTVLGEKEMAYLLSESKELVAAIADVSPKKREGEATKAIKERAKDRDWKKNILELPAGVDVAMFGRMTTGDVFANVDASIHVAHAFTVHEEQAETDYFSAIDDLSEADGETGSGHINTQELTSGLFYGYAVIDVPLLVSNLTGTPRAKWKETDRTLAAEIVQRLIKTIARVSPGAKLGSTAPYALPNLMAVETTTEQPRTLSGAFVSATPQQDPVSGAFEALQTHLTEMDETYGFAGERRHLAVGPDRESLTALGERINLESLARFAAESVLA